eukprot:13175-Heterococcus_DN1.PRE.1
MLTTVCTAAIAACCTTDTAVQPQDRRQRRPSSAYSHHQHLSRPHQRFCEAQHQGHRSSSHQHTAAHQR